MFLDVTSHLSPCYPHPHTQSSYPVPLLTLVRRNPPRLEEPEGMRPDHYQTDHSTTRMDHCLSLTPRIHVVPRCSSLSRRTGLCQSPMDHRLPKVEGWNLIGWLVYPIGGLLVWALTAIVCEWRQRYNDRAIKVLAVLGFILRSAE